MLICTEKECKHGRAVDDMVSVHKHSREGHTLLDLNDFEEKVRLNYNLLINSDQYEQESLNTIRKLRLFLEELEQKITEALSGIKYLAQTNQYNDLKQFNMQYQIGVYNFTEGLLNIQQVIKQNIQNDLETFNKASFQIQWNFNDMIQTVPVIQRPQQQDLYVKVEQPQQVPLTPDDLFQEQVNKLIQDEARGEDRYIQRPNKFDVKPSDKTVKFSDSICALYSPERGYAYIKGKFQSQWNRNLTVLIGTSDVKNNNNWYIEVGVVNVALFNPQEYKRLDKSNFIYTITNSGIYRYPGGQDQRQIRFKQNQEVTVTYQKNELTVSTSENTEVFYVKEHIGTLLQFFIQSVNINLSIK